MDPKAVTVKLALHAWNTQLDRVTKFIDENPDDQFMKEIAPGKNRGIYLIGHLAAIHDALPEILGIGKKAHPELQAIFVQTPDKTIEKIPSMVELRQIWTTVHQRLQKEFEKMPVDAWFARHESMTDADFEKDPARNKLSVLLNRTGHAAYHFGQMRLLK
jgi:DinB superfamily